MIKINNYLINRENVLYIKGTMKGITIMFINNEQISINNVELKDVQEIGGEK